MQNTKTSEENGRKRAESTISFGVSAFPINLANEWDADCKQNFGDCRWIKMWNDHEKSKEYRFYREVMDRLDGLEREITNLKNTKGQNESNVVKTFTKTYGGE